MTDFTIQRTPVERVQVSGNRKRARYSLSVGDTFEVMVRVNGEVQNALSWTATAQSGCVPGADVRVTVIDNALEE